MANRVDYVKVERIKEVNQFFRDKDIRVIKLDAKDLTVDMLDKNIVEGSRETPRWYSIIVDMLYHERDWQYIPRFIYRHIERLVHEGYIAYKELKDDDDITYDYDYIIYELEPNMIEKYGILLNKPTTEVYIYNTADLTRAYTEMKALEDILTNVDLDVETTNNLRIGMMNDDLYDFVMLNTDLGF